MNLKKKLLKVYITKKFIFWFCMYNMWQISKEAYRKCENKIIEDGRYFLINRRDLETESDSGN